MLLDASENRLETTCYDYNGRTPLHCAVKNGSFQCTRWLIQNGSSVHVLDRYAMDNYGRTARETSLYVIDKLSKSPHRSDSEELETAKKIYNILNIIEDSFF
ncbi:hypothetical protein AYI69_g1003 [Smittium culicis]|uniref:Uncharacterized protein n=1 Tax=Smittium culicis TaxID=133412 RepID=A0A1R1YRS7_9FUNG|nr:hypothetical protein AYI69_g1003 [Smittium culicis]